MSAVHSPQILQVGLNSWIIADGNYDDFRVGEVRSFALEYYAENDLLPLSKSRATRSLARLDGSHYAVTGRTLHVAPEWVVIDVGVPAYRELYSVPPPPKRFEGTVWLGVDPFFYFERLARQPGAPALIFDWRILRIEVETAPRILKDGMWIYDPERLKRKDVEDTRDGEDFVLHCELMPGKPRHSLAPAVPPKQTDGL
jgi:hypothetical protein